jgi:plastocyanin
MNSVLRFGLVLVVVTAGVVAGSCGESSTGTENGSDPAGIRVAVTRDGTAASGVVVRLFPVGGTTAQASQTTGSDGAVTFGSLTPGSYEVEVQVPVGSEVVDGAARRPVTAQAGGTATITFALMTVGSGEVVEVVAGGNLQFSPAELTIQAGTTVRWRNEANIVHTITPTDHTEWTEGTVSAAGDVFSHTFTTAGSFPYHCLPHLAHGMTGIVTVQ